MSNTNLRASTLVITLCSLVGMGFATPVHAEQIDTPMTETIEQAAPELDERVCVDANLADEVSPEAQMGPGRLLCEGQCQRQFECAGQGAWCWEALQACVDDCYD